MKNHHSYNGIGAKLKKFALSAFVAVSFIAYALENRGTTARNNVPASGGANSPQTGTPLTNAPTDSSNAQISAPVTMDATPTSPADSGAVTPPTAEPTATSPVVANSSSGFKDGTYTGTPVDINWGIIQVQATVHNGQISNVQFLQVPTERRTSARINSVAVPELQQEAVQAQSANVDIISGATLTSEGFQESLQAALSQAKG